MKVEGGKEPFQLRRGGHAPVSTAYSGAGFPKPMGPEDSMPSGLHSYWRFLLAGLTRQGQTGAVLPSQRFLIDRMIAPVPLDYVGQIVELGAGTGALTMRLAWSRPSVSIVACEINSVLARDVQARIAAQGLHSRIRVVSEPAEHLLARLRNEPVKIRPDFIISGIPLGNLPKEKVTDLIDRIYHALRPGGMYIQFQHSLLDRGKIKARFTGLRTVPVFLNLPPAVVYFAWK